MACEFNDGAILQVTVNGRFNNAAAVKNVWQLKLISGGPMGLSLTGDRIMKYMTTLYDYVKVFCNALTVWDSISAQGLAGVCVTGDKPFAAPIQGALVNDTVPPGVAALMSFQTGVARVTGRKYFGVLDESVIGATGGLTGVFTAAAANVGAYVTSQVDVQGSVWEAGYKSPKTNEWQPFIDYSYSTNPVYQRRRRVGTGE